MGTESVALQFRPRVYQRDVLESLGSGRIKRAALVWHRRAGKDLTAWNWTVGEALRKVGTYFYLFPTYSQGKKVIWDGRDGNGITFQGYIPEQVVVGRNETEMQITLVNGSIIQIIGTDKMEHIVGTNPIGCVFSEFALQNPEAWQLIEPILLENKGWAVFCYTPRGNNHGKRLFEMAVRHPGWYAQMLSIEETQRDDGSPVISEEQIESIRAQGTDEDLIQQEYFCSFTGGQQGSYFSKFLRQSEALGRVTHVAHDPALEVDTVWDLGIGDATAIGFRQLFNQEVRWIDYYEASGEGLPHFASVLAEKARQYDYRYGKHIFPHDAKVRELSTGQSRLETAKRLGIRPVTLAPKFSIEDGIDAIRRRFPLYWFDAEKCGRLVDAIANYRKEWDSHTQCFKSKPVHDWTSHPVDMLRYEAVSVRSPIRTPQARAAVSTFNPITYDHALRGMDVRTDFDPFGLEEEEAHA